ASALPPVGPGPDGRALVRGSLRDGELPRVQRLEPVGAQRRASAGRAEGARGDERRRRWERGGARAGGRRRAGGGERKDGAGKAERNELPDEHPQKRLKVEL